MKIKKMSDGEKKKLLKRSLAGQCCENCKFQDQLRFSYLKSSKHSYCVRKNKFPEIKICSHWTSEKSLRNKIWK